MKKIMIVCSALLLSMAILSSCKKESQNIPTPPVETTFLKCQIDGSEWKANAAITQHAGTFMQIAGTQLTGSNIMLMLIKPIQVGTYYANPNTMSTLTYQKGFANSPYSTSDSPGQGVVNITSVSASQIEGTFQFTGVDFDGNTKEILSGSFKTKIQ